MSIIEQALEKARQEARGQPQNGAPQNHLSPEVLSPNASFPREIPRLSAGITATGELSPAGLEALNLYEAYGLLKERLLALRKRDSALNLFVITSPMRSEGKTFVACNLALSLAREFDNTVLLIDADTRSPSCHRMLGLPRPAGLFECLREGRSFAEALTPTGVPHFSFLSMGKSVPDSAELFSSKHMREILGEIKNRYADRLVIIDTPPFLPFAETRVLCRLADGVILVARENSTLKSHLAASVNALASSRLLGLVYNGAPSRGADGEIFNLGYSY